MKFRFYIGIFLAVFVGFILSSSLMMGFSYISNNINIKLPSISFGVAQTIDFITQTSEVGNKNSKGLTYDNTGSLWNRSGRYKKISEHVSFPKLSAQAYLIADIHTGEVIASKNEDVPHPIASLSKLMTALISVNELDLDNVIHISTDAVKTYGKQGGLKVGEDMSVGTLMYPLLLESSNDAAEAIAISFGRSDFLKKMNRAAINIGLDNTSFEDPSGLSSNNVSSANDLFKLSKYIHQNNDEIFSITNLGSYRYGNHTWFNNSAFRGDSRYYGGKNGYTDEANHTLISIFDLPLETNGKRRVAIILLQSDDTDEDANMVLLYLLKNVYYNSD